MKENKARVAKSKWCNICVLWLANVEKDLGVCVSAPRFRHLTLSGINFWANKLKAHETLFIWLFKMARFWPQRGWKYRQHKKGRWGEGRRVWSCRDEFLFKRYKYVAKNLTPNVLQPFLENINSRSSRQNRTRSQYLTAIIDLTPHSQRFPGLRLLRGERQRNGAPMSICTIKVHWTHINILLHASQLLFHRLLTSFWRWTNVNNVSSKIPVSWYWLWNLTVPHFSVLHGKCTVQKLLFSPRTAFVMALLLKRWVRYKPRGVWESLYLEYNAIFDFSHISFFFDPTNI